MSHPSLSQQGLPAECPQCLHVTGLVCKASTVLHQPAVIRLTLRCDACHHEWLVDAAGEPSYVGEAFDGAQGARIQYH